MSSSSILLALKTSWPAILALLGLGIGLGLNRLAETLSRHHPDAPSIPRRAVWMAVISAFLLGLAGWRFGLTWRSVLSSVYIAILILVTITDLEHRVIPNRVTLPAILLAFVAGFFVDWMTWKAAMFGGATGLVFFSVAYGMASVLYPGKIGLGMGDVTLATFIGLAVGFPSAVVAVVLGVLLGGLASVLLLATRRATLRTAIPYGPFLVLGGLVAMFWGQAIIRWYLRM